MTDIWTLNTFGNAQLRLHEISYEISFFSVVGQRAHMWHLVKETTECGSEVDILLTKAARWDVSNISHIACGPANFFYNSQCGRHTVCRKSHPNIIHSLAQFEIGLQYFLFNERLIRVPFILAYFSGRVKFLWIKYLRFHNGSSVGLYLLPALSPNRNIINETEAISFLRFADDVKKIEKYFNLFVSLVINISKQMNCFLLPSGWHIEICLKSHIFFYTAHF